MKKFIKSIMEVRRSRQTDQRLGALLAFVAGAANAGGFIAMGQYSSHMTGITSSLADNLALGRYAFVLLGLSMLLAFLTGAASTAFLVNWARRARHQNPFVLPVLLEALLLLCFGLFEGVKGREAWGALPVAEMLLAYMMGLQNALITKVAKAEIRTTHVTGMVTDLGIELGKLFYWNRDATPGAAKVLANRKKIRAHAAIFLAFLGGALSGAFGFKAIGYYAVLPLSFALFMITLPHLKIQKINKLN
jgi:uncharacterized membrane protein YoaK (UPF0700 family)